MPVSDDILRATLREQLTELVAITNTYLTHVDEPIKTYFAQGASQQIKDYINQQIRLVIKERASDHALELTYEPKERYSLAPQLGNDTIAHIGRVQKQDPLFSDERRIASARCRHLVVSQLLKDAETYLTTNLWNFSTSDLQTHIQAFQEALSTITPELSSYQLGDSELAKFIKDANGVLDVSAEKYAELDVAVQTARTAISQFSTSIDCELRDQLIKSRPDLAEKVCSLYTTVVVTSATTIRVTPPAGKHHTVNISPKESTLLDLARKHQIATSLDKIAAHRPSPPFGLAQKSVSLLQFSQDLRKICSGDNIAFLESNPDDAIITKFLAAIYSVLSTIGRILGPVGWGEITRGKHQPGLAVTRSAHTLYGSTSGDKSSADTKTEAKVPKPK